MREDPLDLLPHGYPFRLLDKILELDENGGAGIKNVSADDGLFHFRGEGGLAVPEILLVEAMAQLSGLVMNHGKAEGKGAFLVQIDGMELKGGVTPGDSIKVTSRLEFSFSGLSRFSVSAFCGGRLIAGGTLVMAEAAAGGA